MALALFIHASPARAESARSASAPGVIAYTTQAGIQTVALDGTAAQMLIAADRIFVYGQLGQPAWSPDGRHIAYTRVTSGGGTEIWVADADGTGQHMVASHAQSSAMNPAWSPDGRRLAYDVNRALGAPGHRGIYVMRRDGTHKRWLHAGRTPSWSADGKLIAFVRKRLPRGLAVIRPDGTGFRSLDYGDWVRWLEFSPTDPTQLAYTATGRIDPRTGKFVQATRGVFTLDLQRGQPRRISLTRMPGLGRPRDAALTWVPDGRRLAFIDDSTYLSTIRLDGTERRRVLELPGGGFDISWRRQPGS